MNSLISDERLLSILKKKKITDATTIQKETIPLILAGKDVLGLSKTGSGKTLAYLLPMIIKNQESQNSGLVLVPTRELAKQVSEVAKELVDKRTEVATIMGGTNINTEIKILKNNPNLIVATPGRLIAHQTNGLANNFDTITIDELDRMIDIGFRKDVQNIIKANKNKDPQKIVFSATLPDSLREIAETLVKDYVQVNYSTKEKIPSKIEEIKRYPKNNEEKWNMLLEELEKIEEPIIVFVNRKHIAKKLTKNLNQEKIRAKALQGNMSQKQRMNTMIEFSKKSFQILVATDIASRGLDVEDVGLVINYEIPNEPNSYIHRIGRTGRNEKLGKAISLINPEELKMWKAVEIFKSTNKISAPINSNIKKQNKKFPKSDDLK